MAATVQGTVNHVLTMTSPVDTRYENRPEHWNSAHVGTFAMTLNAAGSEISGAFGNGGGVSFGLSADGKVTAAAPAGVPSPVHVSAGTTESDLGTIIFADSNGLAFGLDGSTITGSYTQSTHDHPYRNSTDAVGLNSALTANGVSWTVNSSGISLNVPAYLTTAALSNHSHGNPTLALTNLTGTTASASNGLTLSLSGNAAQTAQSAIEGFGVSNVGNTAGNTGISTGIDWVLAGSGSLTLSQETAAGRGTVHFQHPAWLTTAALSNHSHGNPTLALTNLTGTTASASNGFTLSLSAADPGAAAEANAVHLLGANTAGNTTATGSTIGWSGLNVTLSGKADSQVVISAPATSSLVGTSGISVSTNGSTISIQETPWSAYIVPQDGITIAGTLQNNSSVSIFPFYVPRPLAFSHIKMLASFAYASAANTSSASHAYSASIVLYTRNSDTLSSMWSGKQNSNSFYRSNSTSSLAGVRGINVTGLATTLPPDQYWAAVHFSTTNSGTGGNTTALGASVSMVVAVVQATAAMQADNWNGGGSNQSRALFMGQGLYATGATKGTIGLTEAALSQTGNSATLAEVVLNFQNWTIF